MRISHIPYSGKAATLGWKLYLSFIYLYVMWRVSADRKDWAALFFIDLHFLEKISPGRQEMTWPQPGCSSRAQGMALVSFSTLL